jgi:phospholipase/carboxylesterase
MLVSAEGAMRASRFAFSQSLAILCTCTAAMSCTQAQTIPSEPQHIPGTSESEADEAVPMVRPPTAAPPPQATFVSEATSDDGRLKARPHPPARPDRVTRGQRKLGLGVGGRDGLVFIPAHYDPARPTPLMLLLHGAGGSAERVLRTFRDRADQEGVILIVPDSRGATWDLAIQHTFGPDVEFVDRALAMAFDRWNVDPARVAIAGWSDGASYALSLGITNGDLFGQILAFSPGFAAPGPATGRPRVFVSHGNDDHILPIQRSSGRMVPILEHNGYDVRYKVFDGDHELPGFVLDAAFAWLSHPS